MDKKQKVNPNDKYKNLVGTTVRLGKVTVPFHGTTTQERDHLGVDVAAREGTPIKSPVHGIVSKVDLGHPNGENSYGNTLEIKDKDGKVHQFHHLQGTHLNPGQKVAEGEHIANLGASGACYSPSHSDPSNLDYRIVSRNKKMIDPSKYVHKL